jgi:UDP-glucose:(heptosyl)LPS alpha-1,3-glucosyltransferase
MSPIKPDKVVRDRLEISPASAARMSLGFVFSGCHKRGGVERIVHEAARWFSSRGHEVTVYAEDADLTELPGVSWVRLTPRRRPAMLWSTWFGQAAAEATSVAAHDHVVSFGVAGFEPDVLWVNSVHGQWLRAAISADAGAPLHRHPRLRYLMPKHLGLLWQERRYYSRGAGPVIVVADQVGRDLTALYGVAPSRLTTVHNGFDPVEVNEERSRALRQEARATFGFADGDVVALMVANELPRKGFGELLSAVEAIEDPRLRVLLLGRRAPGAGYRPALDRLGDRIVYGGSLGDMGQGYAAGDVMVLPTRYEAFCLAIVESLAAGLPVITSSAPGAGDLIRPGQNGLILSDPRDVGELVLALRRALDDDERRRWASGAAPSVRHLSWATLCAQVERVLVSAPSARTSAG